ncbi:hypothetical protein [Actinomyces capricornis]|uniref:Uncharacterized protein n=1 Tax=Actinomyces capricornis TaxID=2755559 RepID=A0ABM7U793_9ACTO|nr:hypothetical protein [Actinomyces capricornis]BDA63396.1 hypothetical protein MANAM107_02300 [Actinomyces capricornis]
MNEPTTPTPADSPRSAPGDAAMAAQAPEVIPAQTTAAKDTEVLVGQGSPDTEVIAARAAPPQSADQAGPQAGAFAAGPAMSAAAGPLGPARSDAVGAAGGHQAPAWTHPAADAESAPGGDGHSAHPLGAADRAAGRGSGRRGPKWPSLGRRVVGAAVAGILAVGVFGLGWAAHGLHDSHEGWSREAGTRSQGGDAPAEDGMRAPGPGGPADPQGSERSGQRSGGPSGG